MSCTTWYANGSASIVEQRLAEMQDVGNETLNLAVTAMQALAQVDLDIVTLNDPYEPPSSSYTPYTKPAVPMIQVRISGSRRNSQLYQHWMICPYYYSGFCWGRTDNANLRIIQNSLPYLIWMIWVIRRY